MLLAGLLGSCGDDSDDQATDPALEADTTSRVVERDAAPAGPRLPGGRHISSLEDPAQNTVSYTGIDCRALDYLGRDGAAFRFREVIDRGEGGECKGKGIVVLTPFSDQGVDYSFTGGGIESAGVLKRQD